MHIQNILLNWKRSGGITLAMLTGCYLITMATEYTANIWTGVSLYIAAIILSIAGFIYFWFTIFGFVYAWFNKKIIFPSFLNKKIIISSTPVLIVIYSTGTLFLEKNFIAFEIFNLPFGLLEVPIFFLITYAVMPFESIMKPLGLWADGGLFIINGPTTLGLFLIALIYSALIYITWSAIALWFRQ